MSLSKISYCISLLTILVFLLNKSKQAIIQAAEFTDIEIRGDFSSPYIRNIHVMMVASKQIIVSAEQQKVVFYEVTQAEFRSILKKSEITVQDVKGFCDIIIASKEYLAITSYYANQEITLWDVSSITSPVKVTEKTGLLGSHIECKTVNTKPYLFSSSWNDGLYVYEILTSPFSLSKLANYTLSQLDQFQVVDSATPIEIPSISVDVDKGVFVLFTFDAGTNVITNTSQVEVGGVKNDMKYYEREGNKYVILSGSDGIQIRNYAAPHAITAQYDITTTYTNFVVRGNTISTYKGSNVVFLTMSQPMTAITFNKNGVTNNNSGSNLFLQELSNAQVYGVFGDSTYIRTYLYKEQCTDPTTTPKKGYCELKCDIKCTDCTGTPTNCTSCSHATRLLANTCDCQNTEYADGVECKPCVYPCQTCSAQFVCLSCQTPSNRVSASDCTCSPGWTDNGSNCVQCSYECSTCVSGISNCVNCSHNTRDSSNYCKCKPTYYNVPNQAACNSCSYPCQNCTSPVDCLSCKTTLGRKDQFKCECEDGYMENGSQCLKCAHQCGTCTGSISNCQTCSDSTRNLADSCNCKPTYYNNAQEQVCRSCIYPCQNCTSASICTSCQTTANRNPVSTSCACSTGYFDDTTQCQQCSYKCSACKSLIDCQACTHTTRNVNNQCNCKDGFYNDGTNAACLPCVYPCNTCTSDTVCVTCATAQFRVDTIQCKCSEGYFDDTTQCAKCDHQCKACVTTSANCTECSHVTRVLANQCACQDTYYNFNQNVDCFKCQYPCLNCSALTTCTSCATAAFRVATPSDCACLDFYYDSGLECLACPAKFCKVCLSLTGVCTECDSNLKIVNPEKQCVCKEGYRLGSNQQDCEKIPCTSSLCDLCLSNGNCLKLVPNAAGFIQDGKVNICPKECGSCDETNSCKTCLTNKNREEAPSCKCKSNYFQSYGGDCIQSATNKNSQTNGSSNKGISDKNLLVILVCSVLGIGVIVTGGIIFYFKRKRIAVQQLQAKKSNDLALQDEVASDYGDTELSKRVEQPKPLQQHTIQSQQAINYSNIKNGLLGSQLNSVKKPPRNQYKLTNNKSQY